MSGRVTMRDVALEAGVSPMTVSRAFRSDNTVSDETRTRIRGIAERLGYVYDSNATAFRTQKSGFVAVTLPSINNANFADTYRGLSEAMSGSGMQLLLGATNYRVAKEEELVRQLLTRNPEALILTGGHHTDATRALVRAMGRPVFEIWDLPADPLGHVVGFSNSDAMAMIVEHLAAKGRRRLAFVGASAGTDQRGAERRAGVMAAAERLGLAKPVLLDAGAAPVTMQSGSTCIANLGARVRNFDALVCVSDHVAFGAFSACMRLGLSVPDDLAITGFGHFDVARVAEPRITTVDVGARRIGEEVAAGLDAILAGETAPAEIRLEPRLIPGGTS